MQKSHNVLTIESITQEFIVPDPFTSYMEAKMKATFRCYNPATGNLIKAMIYTITGDGPNTSWAMKSCIQNFLNHNTREKQTEYFKHDHNCEEDLSEIHQIEFDTLPEPFYSMFLGLMDPSKWRAPSTAEMLPLPEEFLN